MAYPDITSRIENFTYSVIYVNIFKLFRIFIYPEETDYVLSERCHSIRIYEFNLGYQLVPVCVISTHYTFNLILAHFVEIIEHNTCRKLLTLNCSISDDKFASVIGNRHAHRDTVPFNSCLDIIYFASILIIHINIGSRSVSQYSRNKSLG